MYLVPPVYDTYVHITHLASVSYRRSASCCSLPKAKTYPQKRTDPILSENVCALTRVYQSRITAGHAAASYHVRATYTR